jgi:hypothetical protein
MYSDPIYGSHDHAEMNKILSRLLERNSILSSEHSSSSPEVYYDAIPFQEKPSNFRSAADLQSLLRSHSSRTVLFRNPSVSSLASISMRSRSQLSIAGRGSSLINVPQSMSRSQSINDAAPKATKRAMFQNRVGRIVRILDRSRWPKKLHSLILKVLITIVAFILFRKKIGKVLSYYNSKRRAKSKI